jgi:hypothetical protein
MDQEVFVTTYQEEIYLIKFKPFVVIDGVWENLGMKEQELLTKIISALKISIDSVTIVSQSPLNIDSFIGKTNKLIYFGDLPTGLSPYETIELGGLSYLCSESLTQLLEYEPARKQLWLGLRKLFSV